MHSLSQERATDHVGGGSPPLMGRIANFYRNVAKLSRTRIPRQEDYCRKMTGLTTGQLTGEDAVCGDHRSLQSRKNPKESSHRLLFSNLLATKGWRAPVAIVENPDCQSHVIMELEQGDGTVLTNQVD